MGKDYYLVLDIGKTNKKIFIYNESLAIADSVYAHINEYDKNGLRFEDTAAIRNFLISHIKKFAQRFAIRAIAVTTHGATFACLDQNGDLSIPVLAYTNEPGPGFHQDFYHHFGGPRELKKETGTPEFNNLLNVAKGIYFIKRHFPVEFEKTAHFVFYPQYFAHLLSGGLCADPSYTGCHHYLWDFSGKRWSSVARKLQITDRLPGLILPSWKPIAPVSPAIAAETGLSPDCLVIAGVHDSNASLLPYLIRQKNDFVLNSTGTWCVAMRSMEEYAFTEDELDKTIFFNLSVFGKPVKTSIFMGGFEYDHYINLLNKNKAFAPPPFDPAAYQEIIDRKTCFLLPSINREIGLFPGSEGRIIIDGTMYYFSELVGRTALPEALEKRSDLVYRLLNLSLAIQSSISFNGIGFTDGMELFTEGGFRNNTDYNQLISAIYPRSSCNLTDLKEATAFGAALLARAAARGTSPLDLADEFTIESERVAPSSLLGMADYIDEFTRRI